MSSVLNMRLGPLDIERRSLDIVERKITSRNYSPNEWHVVRRVIYSTADLDYAGKNAIKFRPRAVEEGIKALHRRTTVITDTEMVKAGINKRSARTLGLQIKCFISDPEVSREASRLHLTKASLAIRRAARLMDGAIVVVGNAPTALLELIEMIRADAVHPALVIGVPVGFVSASESKKRLLKLGIPCISNAGRKGGSSVAASIVNALMELASQTRQFKP